MFEDYKEKVILTYQEKRDAGAISVNLLRPSPGKIKDECLIVYQERCSKKDERAFRLFFGPKDHITDYGQSISKLEIDKFRPLMNFMNRRTNVTEDKNIELLAWLIDFEPRPYQIWNNFKGDPTTLTASEIINEPATAVDNNFQPFTSLYRPEDTEDKETKVHIAGISTTETEIKEETETTNHEIQSLFENQGVSHKKGSKIRKTITSFMIILAASGGTYQLASLQNQECMYWTGDHYKRISCNQKVKDATVLALDTAKAAHLRKITQPDTLTQSSVGKVWYTKIDGELEFYTADGYHPMYNDVRLKPITVYMLNKYILRK